MRWWQDENKMLRKINYNGRRKPIEECNTWHVVARGFVIYEFRGQLLIFTLWDFVARE